MEHYSILLVVQDHGSEIPGLFMVSLIESEPHDKDETGEIKVAAARNFMVAWDNDKVLMLKEYHYGDFQALPENHAFDLKMVIQDYIDKKKLRFG